MALAIPVYVLLLPVVDVTDGTAFTVAVIAVLVDDIQPVTVFLAAA